MLRKSNHLPSKLSNAAGHLPLSRIGILEPWTLEILASPSSAKVGPTMRGSSPVATGS